MVYLRQLIMDPRFLTTYRRKPTAFTRTRKLTFERVLVGLCQVTKMSLQGCLNRFFKVLGEADRVATASAFCQARQHLHAGALRALNTGITEFFYREANKSPLIKTWKGYRLLATDCTYLNLPNTPELRTDFSVHNNKSNKTLVLALGSCLYDVLNDLVLNFDVTPFQAEKTAIFTSHAVYWRTNDLVIYDRGYADYCVIAYHIKASQQFIIRCPLKGYFKPITQFLNSSQTDLVATLTMTPRNRRFIKKYGLPSSVQVRLVKILLPSGETEVLITSLMDPIQYPRIALSELYQLRWGVETYFDRFKNQLDVERFNATKTNEVLQEIYACVLLSTLSSLLSKEIEFNLDSRPVQRKKPRKYSDQFNWVILYSATMEALTELLLSSPKFLKTNIENLNRLMQQTPTPIRPGRAFKRNASHTRHQLNYRRYKKRLWT
ncbi:MAG: IS4 family transposase [Candidatus Hodarchaeota archaeon]